MFPVAFCTEQYTGCLCAYILMTFGSKKMLEIDMYIYCNLERRIVYL